MKCKFCNKSFEPIKGANKNYKGIFCSIACYHKYRWESKGICKNCGKPTTKPVYCSIECRKEFWNKNGFRLNKKYRNWRRKFLIFNKLGGKCNVCGISDIRVLDIHHKDHTKKNRPKDGKYIWSRRLKDWEQNLDNLELLCANCHRIHTWKQRKFGVAQTDMFVGLNNAKP